MATNQNNIHINSFSKGMNTDTSFDMVGNEQYVFGQNIRITANALLQGVIDSNNKEGIITPVPSGQSGHGTFDEAAQKSILAVSALGNIGAIIVKDANHWYIYRVDCNNDQLEFTQIFKSSEPTTKNKFSTVINKELDKVIKLYIADGVHEIMSINLLEKVERNLQLTENDLINNKYFPVDPVRINEKISGTLHTGQIQYTYRFYNKYGVCSKMAPLTNKIQVIDPSRSKEIGNAEDTQTTIGFQLLINYPEEAKRVFNHIQIYRLLYTKPNTDAKVDLIYDSKISSTDQIKINDGGLESIQELSIQEFAALDTIDIKPSCIEQNQNYLFAADITDETRFRTSNEFFNARSYQYTIGDGGNGDKIVLYENHDTTYKTPAEFNSPDDVLENYTLNKYVDMTIEDVQNPCKVDKDGYFGGTGKNVSWRFVTTEIPLDSINEDKRDAPPAFEFGGTSQVYWLKANKLGEAVMEDAGITTDDVFNDHNVCVPNKLGYDDIFTSSIFRTLKRDEVYRYGIVLYDKSGRRSDVQWIADVKTPSEKEFSSTTTSSTSSFIEQNEYTWQVQPYHYIRPKKTEYSDHFGSLGGVEYEYEYQKDGQLVTVSVDRTHQFTVGENDRVSVRVDENSLCDGTIHFSLQEPIEQYGGLSGLNNMILDIPVRGVELKNFYKYINQYAAQHYGQETPLVTSESKVTVQMRANRAGNVEDVQVKGVWIEIMLNPESDFKYVSIDGFEINPVIKAAVSKYSDKNKDTQNVYARPIGIQFDVRFDEGSGISSYQIVRCAKTASYTKNLMQCVTSRPNRQRLYSASSTSIKYSPYYPSPFLTSDYLHTLYTLGKEDIYSNTSLEAGSNDAYFIADNVQNRELFQIFSPEIQISQEDSISKLQSYISKVHPIMFLSGLTVSEMDALVKDSGANTVCMRDTNQFPGSEGLNDITYVRACTKGADANESEEYDKQYLSFIFKYYDKEFVDYDDKQVQDVQNVANPTWEQGFSNINISGEDVVSGVKQYKSFSASIYSYEYVNWVCNGMYDIKISPSTSQQQGINDSYNCAIMDYKHRGDRRHAAARGWIGPGPKCFVMKINNDDVDFMTNFGKYNESTLTSRNAMSTCLVNITHVPSQYAGLTEEERQYDIYYGFGNIKKVDGKPYNVFDGDAYITPCEITTIYKAYDFNSYDTLPSCQIVYYIPMESSINTYFDYGMCYKNTQSKNVQIEPGEITGVVSQSRPEHQYNMIYSDNNVSNDIYNVQSLEDPELTFPQRIHYSQLKTNGELIDNWQMFKPLDYIDADTRYGDITNLLTNKETIYFWQKQAFGKLSVNERSLVTDNNSNTVQLGQGGVLQRTDYINTRYGMREEDYSAISAEGSIYWIDIVNKAILMSNGQAVVNIGEQTNVQSCINKYITEDIPTIHYDLQNNELLCKCLGGKQMVFNVKLNVATSIYDRSYEDMIMFDNVLYGIYTGRPGVLKYNYLADVDGNEIQYNEPARLEFVVNPSASITKVFDNQEIVTMQRGGDYTQLPDYFDKKQFSFTTNILDTVDKNPEGYTDREGNIRYAVPRYAEDYGNRIRGKWMKVDIEDGAPRYEHSISHVLTKFRQSFI